MMLAQLSYRESLCDIVACLRSQQCKLYHLGIRGKASRSTLADAKSRDWRIYSDFFACAKGISVRWRVTVMLNQAAE